MTDPAIKTIAPDYVSDDGEVALYCADCLDVLPTLGKVDAVVTDPPYGVGFDYESHNDTADNWRGLMNAIIPWIRLNAQMSILPSCQIKQLPWIYLNHTPDWLICWYKGSPGHSSFVGFNDWEPLLVYGKRKGVQFHDYFYTKPSPFNKYGHPCPKPVEWALWVVARISINHDTILDPFMGSGTTGVAAVRLGRKFIGIEIERKYFEVAKQRIVEEKRQMRML